MRNMNISKRIARIKKATAHSWNIYGGRCPPLIKKYAGRTHFMEYADACQEYLLTLIEAVQKIKSYDTDRLFLAYAVKCIKNKFCTLYKEHCAEVPTESDTEILLEKNSNAYTEEGYRDIVLAIDLNAFIRGINSGKKQKIAILFLVFQKSDSEIASMLGVSRQYVNRVRRELLTELASFYS